MASITDYLAKQLFIEKNVVTYRSLSRQFNIHVNAAKNELATYHESPQSSSEKCHATYMVSGEPFAQPNPPSSQAMVLSTQEDDGMDIDQPTQSTTDERVMDLDSDPVPQVKMTLVGEQDLEHLKTKYARIYSQHIYCLSPSPLVDPGLICNPSSNIYSADAKLSPDQAILLGRVIGADVKIGKVQTAKGKSSLIASRKPGLASTASSSKIKEEPKDKVKKEEKDVKVDTKSTPPTASKPKATGKLDWSRAKTKETKKAEKEKPAEKEQPKEIKPTVVKEEESKPAVRIGPPAKSKKVKVEASEASSSRKSSKPASSSSAASSTEPPKRGVKRKSVLPLDSDSDSPIPSSGPSSRAVSPPVISKGKSKSSASNVRPKTKAISISDDDDEEDVQPKRRIQAKKSVDKSLRAMMDMDDGKSSTPTRIDLVIKHSRKATSPPPSSDGETTEHPDEPEEPEEPDVDVEMVEEEIKPAPKKKKVKKVIPVGRNGLKKRRVVKSRMTTDAKGYMVTEDYSEYESVDEEEPSEAKPKAKKAVPKGKKIDTSDIKPSKTVTKSKSTTSLKGKKSGGLMDFFGKK